MKKYNIAIIGAGVSGTAIARELSRYQTKICVLEREEDALLWHIKGKQRNHPCRL